MLADAQIIGFIPVSSIETATQFYCGTLGLRMVGNDGFALVLSAGGVMVRCAATPGFKPQPFTIFGWEVVDVNAKARELAAAGIVFLRFDFFQQDEDGVWTAPGGSKVAWFNDLDGNVLSLSHHAVEQV
ncbi:hypothetical protein SAMN05421770_106299 [Granulicella rosea]|uniref:VOC domain-containing protein n=1 Tax=Granulicella rosea TaxID=474952 RepID=A0A239LD53_9BACT|nr:VOC family protein [Granulicella rosea]SNT28220.1 hypothetical protein SAMN05421770_106299 [Granulicella rosea]